MILSCGIPLLTLGHSDKVPFNTIFCIPLDENSLMYSYIFLSLYHSFVMSEEGVDGAFYQRVGRKTLRN